MGLRVEDLLLRNGWVRFGRQLGGRRNRRRYALHGHGLAPILRHHPHLPHPHLLLLYQLLPLPLVGMCVVRVVCVCVCLCLCMCVSCVLVCEQESKRDLLHQVGLSGEDLGGVHAASRSLRARRKDLRRTRASMRLGPRGCRGCSFTESLGWCTGPKTCAVRVCQRA